MVDGSAAPAACRRPELGALVEEYAQGALDADRRDAFEAHYFDCPACLKELQTLQSLREALTPRRRSRLFLGALAASLVGAIAMAWYLYQSRTSPHLLELSPATRGAPSSLPSAAQGEALQFSLLVVGGAADAAFDAEILDPSGGVVFEARDIPQRSGWVVLTISDGFSQEGLYRVQLTERGPQEGSPPPLQYFFEVRAP